MQYVKWLILALVVVMVVPVFAGGKEKCTMDTQTCLDKYAAKLKHKGWVGIEMDKAKEQKGLLITRVVPGSPAEAAGLQVAIWELLVDFGSVIDLTSGDFEIRSPGAVETAAQGYLSALPADLSGYTTTSFIVASDNGRTARSSQHMIVPEPMTAGLMGITLPLFLLRRKRSA